MRDTWGRSMSKGVTMGLLALVLLAAWATPSRAASILFAQVSSGSPYVADGNQLAAMLTAGGNTVTTRFLDTAVYTDYASFDQVWVYDLSYFTDNSANQQGNYTNIADWYNARTKKNLITDGRMISSAPGWTAANGGMPSETPWIQNYASELNARGGGLVLGTDHNDYHSGINTINSLIGINLFTGFYGQYPTSQAVVDTLSPLYIGGLATCRDDATLKCINDNSTTGFAPTGLQPNGQTLTPVAYHGTALNAWDQAAVSASMGSRTFGTCGNPGQPPCDVPEPSALALAGLAAVGLGLARRWQRSK